MSVDTTLVRTPEDEEYFRRLIRRRTIKVYIVLGLLTVIWLVMVVFSAYWFVAFLVDLLGPGSWPTVVYLLALFAWGLRMTWRYLGQEPRDDDYS